MHPENVVSHRIITASTMADPFDVFGSDNEEEQDEPVASNWVAQQLMSQANQRMAQNKKEPDEKATTLTTTMIAAYQQPLIFPHYRPFASLILHSIVAKRLSWWKSYPLVADEAMWPRNLCRREHSCWWKSPS